MPDAGQLLQEMEKGLEAKPIPTPPVPESKEEFSPNQDEEKVVINKIFLHGNTIISSDDLQDLLAQFLGRKITITELKTTVDVIAKYYQDRGYIASATFPEQDISGGVLTIDILEARYGGIKINGEFKKDYSRIDPKYVDGVFNLRLKLGEVIDHLKIDRAILQLQQLAGFDLDSNLVAGEEIGTTKVGINIKDRPFFSAFMNADNSGGRSTGRYKETLTSSLASPLRRGDQFDATYMHTEGSDYLNLAYKVPVGFRGISLGAGVSYLKYDIILGENGLADIKPRGVSRVFNLNASYPIYLDRQTSISLTGNLDRKNFLNQRLDTGGLFYNYSNYQLRALSVVLNASHTDGFFGGGQTIAYWDESYGKVDLTDSANQQSDADSDHTAGRYQRLKLGLTRYQFFGDNWTLQLSGSGQMANHNLDSSEKFYLGGVTGVRAYPTSEGSGSEGYLFKAELQRALPFGLKGSVFYDDGYVVQYQHNLKSDGSSVTADGVPNNYHLSGFGGSLSWSGPYQSQLKLTYARRLGGNPNPAANKVNDQDGTLYRNVFWFSGGIGL